MPDTTWAVTEIAHPALRDVRGNCADCLAFADRAITTARVTGSVGATYGDDNHSATVVRAIMTMTDADL